MFGQSSSPRSAPAAGAAAPLWREYSPLGGHYDEMCAGVGELRPPWDYLMRSFEALGGEEFGERRDQVARLLYENGVTYNVYDDPQRGERLWPLDPIPVLFSSAEWSLVEQGLSQRAEIFSLLLADLYGERNLLRRGLLPPELVFSHPGFLLPCAGEQALGRGGLPLYAADFGRDPDGRFVVIGDRTQSPSGMGYALENRTVLSRLFPSLYRDSHVHRLALFFRGLRGCLARLAPTRDEAPRIVLLTPGPENETYFEHAFLASYLGYSLVQGRDLLVYDDAVWLKTMDGHKRVDVVLRRVDDAYCDPLELHPESVLGTPGLLQAARLGTVVIANALGSSVLENPGLMPFLAPLCRELLGEELKLDSVRTWWCGRPSDLAYVLENLSRLVLKPIVPHASAVTAFGPLLSAGERQAIVERIQAQPHLYVGQEQVLLSTAPSAADTGLEPRSMVVRGFVANGEHGPIVMPGGLCRVAPSSDSLLVSNQRGGVSKDVWVLASEPERQISLLSKPSASIEVKRDGDEVPGRVADDLFWLGRYAERTESSARLLREVVLRALSSERVVQDDAMPLLLRAVTVVTGTYPGFLAPEGSVAPSRDAELVSVIYDRQRIGSIRYDIEAMVRAGRSLRDRLSGDASRVVAALKRDGLRGHDLSAGLESLQRVVILLAAFAGLCRESMTRGQGWTFLEIGRTLERGVRTASLLRAVAVPATSGGYAAFEALLAVAHSLKTYRRRYRSQAQPAAVLDLLLLDESNPRSVAYQLVRLQDLVASLEGEGLARRSTAGRLALEACTVVRLADLDGLMAAESPTSLDAMLRRILELLAALSDELMRRFFAGMEAPQQLVRVA